MRVVLRRCLATYLALVAVVGLYPGASTAADTYYRWRDADGNLVISDRPPPAGQPYETVGGDGRERRLFRPSLPANETEDGANGAQTDDAIRDARTCQVARDNLHTLETTEIIRTRDADGNYHFLTDEEKAIQIERARSLIRVHCAPGNSRP